MVEQQRKNGLERLLKWHWLRGLMLAVIFGGSGAIAQAQASPTAESGENLNRTVTISEELSQVMGAGTFAKAGIAELTGEQQLALLNWLRSQPGVVPNEMSFSDEPANRGASTDPVVAQSPASALGAEQLVKPKAPVTAEAVVETSIVGEFRGWNGSTRFRLANGQVWQQRVAGRYKARLDSPRVRVEKSIFGYRLSMVNARGKSTRSVGVKRIK